MATSFTDWESDYLAHFGIQGMKWGQRRFQNPDGSLTALGRQRYGMTDAHTGGDGYGTHTRKGIQKDLNKLDSEQAYARYRAAANRKREAKLHTKMVKAEKAGNQSRVEKLSKKIEKAKNSKKAERASQYEDLLKRSESMTKRIIESAKSQGYTVKSKNIQRSVNVGRNALRTALVTAGMTSGIQALGGFKIPMGNNYLKVTGAGLIFGESAPGKKYSVRRKKTTY